MSLPEMQARVRSRIWQAVAQSGVNVSSLPQADMDTLVNTITDSVLQEMDTLLGDETGQPSSKTLAPVAEVMNGEQVLWEGRPFLTIGVKYQITTQRVRIVEGVLGKSREDIELVRVQDIDQTQSMGERLVGVGDIHIRSHDPSSPEVVLNNLSNVQEVHEILRAAVLAARKRYGVSYREEM